MASAKISETIGATQASASGGGIVSALTRNISWLKNRKSLASAQHRKLAHASKSRKQNAEENGVMAMMEV